MSDAAPRPAGGTTIRLLWRLARGAGVAALVVATGRLWRSESLPPDAPAGTTVLRGLAFPAADGRTGRLDVYRPVGSRSGGRPVVVALHGGGWRGGSRSDYGREAAAVLGPAGVAVVAVDYKLARPGAASWPANLEDVRAALRWVAERGPSLGLDPARVALMGASAGGHLALLAAADAAAAGGAGGPGVRAVVDWYGPTDLVTLVGTAGGVAAPVSMMLGGPLAARPDAYAEASPVRRVSPAWPPVLILHGGDDLLIPRSQSEALAAALGRAGVRHRLVVVPGARHGFGWQAGGRDLRPDLLAFLADAWKD